MARTNNNVTQGGKKQQQRERKVGNAGANRASISQKNIILFGATGSGKSSIVNMLLPPGNRPALTSSAANLVTFKATAYPADIEGERYQVYDTAGLSEGNELCSKAARKTLETLLLSFSGDGKRIHLLVLCIRAPRVTEVVAKNYRLFYQTICKHQVPIAVVVTGLENEVPTMESWWEKNKRVFDQYRMAFFDHACITATRGKRTIRNGRETWAYEKEYEQSLRAVRRLIKHSALSLDKGRAFDKREFGKLWLEIRQGFTPGNTQIHLSFVEKLIGIIKQIFGQQGKQSHHSQGLRSQETHKFPEKSKSKSRA